MTKQDELLAATLAAEPQPLDIESADPEEVAAAVAETEQVFSDATETDG